MTAMSNELKTTSPSPSDQTKPKVFESVCEFRWCYYHHLGHSSKTDPVRKKSVGREDHTLFEVPTKARPVLVLGYFRVKKHFGQDFCLICQLTKSEKSDAGKKPNHIHLGHVISKYGSDFPTWVQTISERYPMKLIERAEADLSKEPIIPCEEDRNAIRRIVEHYL